jgi:hypothetical protein
MRVIFYSVIFYTVVFLYISFLGKNLVLEVNKYSIYPWELKKSSTLLGKIPQHHYCTVIPYKQWVWKRCEARA